MIGTTLTQSRKLLELGIDPKTADMCWSNASVRGVNYTDAFELALKTKEHLEEIFNEAYHDCNKFWKLVPAWSLEALLELMPRDITSEENGQTFFNIFKIDDGGRSILLMI